MAIITFSGHIGSGKSTVAHRIAKELGYQQIYVGEIMRMLASERNMSLEDFSKALEKDPELERSVDGVQIAFMKEMDDAVIQGRMSFFFVKQIGKPAINIFLTVDPRIAAERKVKEGGYPGKSIDDVLALHEARAQSERIRYQAIYGISDHLDPGNFDIICDTTHMTPDEVVAFLLNQIQKRLEK